MADTITTFLLVRHGETEFNRASIMQGRRVNSRLNDTGRRQARLLAQRLSSESIDAIYTSTLLRAHETASIIADQLSSVPVVAMQDLEEMSWGILDGTSPGSGLEAVRRRWMEGDFGHAVEDGESILDVQRRAWRAIHQILEAEKGSCVVIVTHGRFLRVLLATLLEEYGLERMDDLHHSNTGLNQVIFDGSSFSAQLLNCTRHLDVESDVILN